MPHKALLTLHIQQIEQHDKDIAKAMQILHNSCLNSKHQFEKCFETRLIKGSYPPGDLVLIWNPAIKKKLNQKTKL